MQDEENKVHSDPMLIFLSGNRPLARKQQEFPDQSWLRLNQNVPLYSRK